MPEDELLRFPSQRASMFKYLVEPKRQIILHRDQMCRYIGWLKAGSENGKAIWLMTREARK